MGLQMYIPVLRCSQTSVMWVLNPSATFPPQGAFGNMWRLCTCSCMCRCGHTCGSMCMWRPEVKRGCHFWGCHLPWFIHDWGYHLPWFIGRQGLSLAWEISRVDWLPESPESISLVIALPALGLKVCAAAPCFVTWVLGNQNQVQALALYWPCHFLSPTVCGLLWVCFTLCNIFKVYPYHSRYTWGFLLLLFNLF